MNKEQQQRQQEVIARGDAWAMYYFACQVKGANLEELAAAVIASGEVGVMYLFASHVGGAPANALMKAVIKSGDSATMSRLFAHGIKKGVNVDELQKLVIASGDAAIMYSFALGMGERADLETLKQAVIDSGDVWYMHEFVRAVHGAGEPACFGFLVSEFQNRFYGAVYYHKDTQQVCCGCRCFTIDEAIKHWRKGSESGGKEFARQAVTWLLGLVKQDARA